jgi:SPP1 gp7 family putative phage head morphogenesis protein
MGLFSFKKLSKIIDSWGRFVDRSSWEWRGLPPQENPDDTTSDQYWDISNNPHIVAGMAFADVSHLFVSARGMNEEESGATYPAQIIYTTPSLASQEILDLVSWQFDEEFAGGFGEVIRASDTVCKSFGRAVLEYEWAVKDAEPHKGKAFVKRVYVRDPEPYIFDKDGKPGIYKDNGFGVFELMDSNKFQSYAYNPLFNNPYGASINFPLKPWVETFNKVFGYWRHALEKAGLGSWGASYPNAWLGKDAVSTANRAALEEAIKKVAGGTWSIYPEGAKLENFKLQMEATAFLDWYTAFCEVVSLIYTGTTTALKEAEYGSKSAAESGSVREKSQREKFNAARVSAFWTWEFIPLLVNVNFPPDKILSYPTLQLIKPELIMPVTPKDQDVIGQDNEGNPTEEETPTGVKKEKPDKPQEEPEEKDTTAETEFEGEPKIEAPKIPPVAIPPTFKQFPDEEPEPAVYSDVTEKAIEQLAKLQVKNYPDVNAAEAPYTFTIKRLRSYPDALQLLTDLKAAIMPTMDAPTEADAWKEYYVQAVRIFNSRQISMTPQIRDDLIVSFRQARQNAFGRAIREVGRANPEVIGFRLETKDDPRVRPIHKLWNGVTLQKDNPLVDELATPMDFQCRCNWLPVYQFEASNYPFTSADKIPGVKPGESYRYYATQYGEEID